MRINCIERVLIATPSIDEAQARWSRAGFAFDSAGVDLNGIRFARFSAGAIEIDLCAATNDASGPLSSAIADAASRGGGIIGWTWGVDSACDGTAIELPRATARVVAQSLPGVVTASLEISSDQQNRRELCREKFGANSNTVDFLEHIVVMTPVLEDAIAVHESIGVPCKRIREVGNGMRQAFFKLEQTVIEVVGPSRERAGCWGLAFMCVDIAKAVAIARENGFQATEPKKAIQGGLIARIVEPLDGVAVAYMQAP